jgi:hypothetical protein
LFGNSSEMQCQGKPDSCIHRKRPDKLGIDFGEEIFPHKDPHVLFGFRNSDAGQLDSLKIMPVVLIKKTLNSLLHNGEHSETYQGTSLGFGIDAFADYLIISLQRQVQEKYGTNKHYQKGAVVRRVL